MIFTKFTNNERISSEFEDVLKVVNSLPKKELLSICNGTYKNSPYTIIRKVLLVNEIPVSYIEVYELPKEKNIGYIGIATNPKYRGKGYSQRLIKLAEDINYQNKLVNQFYWEAHKENTNSQRLAEKCGYEFFYENNESYFYRKTFNF